MKNIIRIILSFVILSFIGLGQSYAQFNNHLILKKGAKNKMHFLIGDSVILMKHNFKTPSREQIQAIGEDYIIIREEKIPLKDITGIVKERALHFKTAGTIFKIAGPTLIFLDVLNSLIANFRPLIGTNVAIAALAISGTGFILPMFQNKVYYMKRGYYLRIVPSDPESIRTLR